jgi:cyclopropane fatty-acyl-phospholipid synthase-like methyltransferase
VPTRAETANIERFTDSARRCCTPIWREIEAEAIGSDHGSTGYTTVAQAERILEMLRLAPGDRLADIGSGSGWPALYLAARSGCCVVGTDLPMEGLRRARERAIEDGVARRASFMMATGRHQPLRAGSFDAVVHTDVLCCLNPKLAVLKACRGVLRAGGRLAYTTIYVAEGLSRADHRQAVRAGPPFVTTRRPYVELTEQAGFVDVVEHDVTDEYARTQAAWYAATEARAEDLIRLTSVDAFAVAQRDRRRARDAIADGLLCRTLIAARTSRG